MNVNHLFINLTDPVLFQNFGGEEAWARVDVPAGATVFEQGDSSQDFFYIFSGLVSVDQTSTSFLKGPRHLATLTAGDFFGEGALLSDKTRAATVTALKNTTLLKLSQARFEALVVRDPQAATGILLGIVKVLNARLQDLNQRISELETDAEVQ